MSILLLYGVMINILTFLVYAIDKFKARNHRWRIPEATLIGLAAIGGSIGAWTAMYIVRHKTQHAKFRYGIPILLALQLILACCIIGN